MVKFDRSNNSLKQGKDLVNKCIENGFGKNFKGDWHIVRRKLGPNFYVRGPIPMEIGRNRFGGLSFEKVGFFTNMDGSELTVKEEYQDQAEEYGKEYESKVKKEVTIKVIYNL